MAVAFVVVFIIIITGARWAYLNERRCWNNGHCVCCGAAWQHYDTCSGGSRCYKCSDGCSCHTWVSYGFDKKPHICSKHNVEIKH